jgi:hypothetical protein
LPVRERDAPHLKAGQMAKRKKANGESKVAKAIFAIWILRFEF